MRSRGWTFRAKFYFMATLALIFIAWIYTWFTKEVPLHHQLLIPFAFVTLGMAIKYGDQAFDINVGSKRKALALAIPAGMLMGALVLLDGDSATIFIGLLLALFIAGKYDNKAFWLGFLIAGGISILAIFMGTPLHAIGIAVVTVSAVLDEKLNDWADRRDHKDAITVLAKERVLLKLAVLALCMASILSTYLYFIAFIGFDFGYAFVEQISISGGIGDRTV